MDIDSGLAGKVALVTGGSRGIGRAVVELFARDGMDVVFFYRGNADAAQQVVAAVQSAGGRCEAMQVDVADAEAVATAVERVVDSRERIDVLVNNAGIVRDNILGMLEDEDIRAVLDTNVGGVFLQQIQCRHHRGEEVARGQLQQDDPDVIHDGKEQFPESV